MKDGNVFEFIERKMKEGVTWEFTSARHATVLSSINKSPEGVFALDRKKEKCSVLTVNWFEDHIDRVDAIDVWVGYTCLLTIKLYDDEFVLKEFPFDRTAIFDKTTHLYRMIKMRLEMYVL